ncbi:MAG: response regulator [Deltaproteobacteria bacterium]|jgi:DNA-binding NtrC family response regulator|nr:response regulator [Deltaproteobacteria bacterium]
MVSEIDRIDGLRILIVDDEPDILESLEELLPMCELIKAHNFEEAKKHLENDHFDICILDIMGVDGYQLLEIANEKDVIAVMLTGHSLSVGDTVRSFKEGAAYYVPKEKMAEIATYLNDVLEVKKENKSLLDRWLDRFVGYYDSKFGQDWQDEDKAFWKRFRI